LLKPRFGQTFYLHFCVLLEILIDYFPNRIEKINLVLLTQYCAGDKMEKNEMGWACGAYGCGEGVYRVLVGKPEGRRTLGRPRHRWGIILGWISRRLDVGIWTGLGWPRIETGDGCL